MDVSLPLSHNEKNAKVIFVFYTIVLCGIFESRLPDHDAIVQKQKIKNISR